MIATVKHTKSPKSSSMGYLVDYLTKDKGNAHRVEEVWTANCLADENDLDWCKKEIQYTTAMNTRAEGAKAYHMIISFQEDERPDADTLRDITRNYAEVLGFGEHQYVCVAHGDTENFHVHMAFNKIHPTNFNCHTPYYDFDKLAAMSSELEIKHNLGRDNHAVTNNVSSAVAEAMERAGGKESLIGYVRRSCTEGISQAGNWKELHLLLADYDISLAKRGNGLVFQSNTTGTRCKISSVSRNLSLDKLVKRFGPYEESQGQAKTPKKKYQELPMEVAKAPSLYQQYQADQQSRKETVQMLRSQNRKEQRLELDRVYKEYNGEIDRLSREMKSRIVSGKYKVQIFKELTKKRKKKSDEIRKIQTKYSRISKAITGSNPHEKWLDWLAKKAANGDKDALLFLADRNLKPETSQGQSLTGDEKESFINRLKRFVSKKGTIFHSQGIRETKKSIDFRSASDEELLTGLKLAISRFGNEISANGNDAFKKRLAKIAVKNKLSCIFTDETTQAFKAELETRRERAEKRAQQSTAINRDAMKYINSRNEARAKIKDIKEHVYGDKNTKIEEGIFRGIRNSNNSKLVLVEAGNKVYVVPYTDYGAKRLAETQIKVGQAVQLTQGRVKASKSKDMERD